MMIAAVKRVQLSIVKIAEKWTQNSRSLQSDQSCIYTSRRTRTPNVTARFCRCRGWERWGRKPRLFGWESHSNSSNSYRALRLQIRRLNLNKFMSHGLMLNFLSLLPFPGSRGHSWSEYGAKIEFFRRDFITARLHRHVKWAPTPPRLEINTNGERKKRRNIYVQFKLKPDSFQHESSIVGALKVIDYRCWFLHASSAHGNRASIYDSHSNMSENNWVLCRAAELFANPLHAINCLVKQQIQILIKKKEGSMSGALPFRNISCRFERFHSQDASSHHR